MSTIETIASVIQALAMAGGAVIAWRGVGTWRHEVVGKRKLELAEEVLAKAYEARDVIEFARNGVVNEGEGASRPRDDREREEDSSALDATFVPIEWPAPIRWSAC